MNANITFCPLSRADFPMLERWLHEPHVAKWFQDPHDFEVEAKYGPRVDGSDPCEVFVILADSSQIGIIQRYKVRDYPSWEQAFAQELGSPLAGIDYLIGEVTRIGQGIGSAAIQAFSAEVFIRYPDVGGIIVGPQQEDVASWRALEKAGFKRVWSGRLDSELLSDAGPAHVYLLRRPQG